jgi:hypothetical protein
VNSRRLPGFPPRCARIPHVEPRAGSARPRSRATPPTPRPRGRLSVLAFRGSFARFCAVFRESVKKVRCRSAAAGGSGHSRRVPGFHSTVRSYFPMSNLEGRMVPAQVTGHPSHASPTRTAFRSRVLRRSGGVRKLPRVRSRADYDGGARLTRLLAGRERRTASPRPPRRLARVAPSGSSLRSSRRARGRTRWRERAAPGGGSARRLAAAGRVAGSESRTPLSHRRNRAHTPRGLHMSRHRGKLEPSSRCACACRRDRVAVRTSHPGGPRSACHCAARSAPSSAPGFTGLAAAPAPARTRRRMTRTLCRGPPGKASRSLRAGTALLPGNRGTGRTSCGG